MKKNSWQTRHYNSLKSSYGKSPFFSKYSSFFEHLYFDCEWEYLSELNLSVLRYMFQLLRFGVKLSFASTQNFTQSKSNLILEHARKFDAEMVVTGTFGKDYIVEDDFKSHGIGLYYQEYQHPTYPQRFGDFVPFMSAVDLLFNVGESEAIETIKFGNVQKEELCRN